MTTRETVSNNESAPLLSDDGGFRNTRKSKLQVDSGQEKAFLSALAVLPLALFSALGIAATAATSVFAYAYLLCDEPTHCRGSEQREFAKSVALAATVSNACSILAIGSLGRLLQNHRKTGLGLWIVCRSMSVVTLALGVYFRSITVAISGRVFQGVASDNLLHFSLNAMYVQLSDRTQAPRLLGGSLASYMIGISLGPYLAGLFPNFIGSFYLAWGTFAFSFAYLVLLVPKDTRNSLQPNMGGSSDRTEGTAKFKTIQRSCMSLARSTVSPLRLFYEKPSALPLGVALLIHNGVQSYTFPLLMVSNTLRFGFSSRENGQVLSLVHGISATYMFLVLFVLPAIQQRFAAWRNSSTGSSSTRYAFLTYVSLVTQALGLITAANSTRSWHIYVVGGVLALGLATPSFIKAHFLGFFRKDDDLTRAMGAMAMMEILGGLLFPLILGLWQATWPGVGVFYGAAAMIGLAIALFSVAAVYLYKCRIEPSLI